jgi:transposase
MVKYSPIFKHNILTQYASNKRGNGFDTLAKHFHIAGGGSTIKYWFDRWDGTATSLEHRHGAGRPTIMNTHEMKQHILAPIKHRNKKHEAVNYTTIHRTLKSTINKSVSLSTIKRYGKEKLGIKKKRTKKCMNRECECFLKTMKQNINS